MAFITYIELQISEFSRHCVSSCYPIVINITSILHEHIFSALKYSFPLKLENLSFRDEYI
jgi:hypothetical protein